MLWTLWIGMGSLLAGLSVALGAFGAHALKDRLEPDKLQVFETAVQYQMYHALALALCGLVALRLDGTSLKAAAISFLIGTVLFSGSLYGLVFTGTRALGMITPFGGVAFLLGWILLAYTAFKPLF